MIKHLDNTLLLIILALIGFGLVQVYSSSFIFATESLGDGLYFFRRQFIFSIFSVGILIVSIILPWKWVEKYGFMVWIFSTVGLVMSFIPGLGIKAGGAARWVALPFGFRFEPGELLKFSFPLLVAHWVSQAEQGRRQNFIFKAALLLTPMILLLKQPDFGSFLIILIVGCALLFAFGLKWRYILALTIAAVPAFFMLVWRVPYRQARVMAFLDPWSDPEQKGFQAIQSMLSFQNGGLKGVGLGQGQGKLFFLPEAHTDFTLAVFGEETGFIGFLILISIYGYIVLRGFQVAMNAKNGYRKTVALGISLVFAISVFINAGVVMGMLPTKGLTLPFLSYGGSSLFTLCFVLGLLINLERTERPENL
jgi:cell division protein FtsW